MIVLNEDDAQAESAHGVMAQAERILDAARESWWIGLRDAEEEEYTGQGRDFKKDEMLYGAALRHHCIPARGSYRRGRRESQKALQRRLSGRSFSAGIRARAGLSCEPAGEVSELSDTLLNIAVLVGILLASALLTNLFARAMYNRCAGCGTLNAKRRAQCRACNRELR